MNAIAQRHTAQEQEVLDAFNRHVAAFNSGNLDAVLKDFGEHSVVVTPDGVFEGRERICALYQKLDPASANGGPPHCDGAPTACQVQSRVAAAGECNLPGRD